MAAHCAEFHIPSDAEGVIRPIPGKPIPSELLTEGWSYLSRQGIHPQWGDLVLFDSLLGYRNEGVMISDGHSLHELDYEIDEYGALPSEFTVLEGGRPLDYWAPSPGHHGIDHNSIIWFPYWQHATELKENVTYAFDATENLYMMWSVFTYQGLKYRLIYDYPDYVYQTYSMKPNWTNNALNLEQRAEVQTKFLEDIEKHLELYYEGDYTARPALYLRPSPNE